MSGVVKLWLQGLLNAVIAAVVAYITAGHV